MESTQQSGHVELDIERLTTVGYAKELIQGIGLTLGMGILWSLEIVRNAYFRMLDRLNVKPRRKPASAFPPGRPRKRRQARA